MSKEFPITISSWTLGDQCKFEDRVKAAKEAGYEGIGLSTSTETVGINKDITIDLIINEHQSKIELTVLVYYQHELTQQIRSVLEK